MGAASSSHCVKEKPCPHVERLHVQNPRLEGVFCSSDLTFVSESRQNYSDNVYVALIPTSRLPDFLEGEAERGRASFVQSNVRHNKAGSLAQPKDTSFLAFARYGFYSCLGPVISEVRVEDLLNEMSCWADTHLVSPGYSAVMGQRMIVTKDRNCGILQKYRRLAVAAENQPNRGERV